MWTVKTTWIPGLICVFTGCTGDFLVLSCWGSNVMSKRTCCKTFFSTPVSKCDSVYQKRLIKLKLEEFYLLFMTIYAYFAYTGYEPPRDKTNKVSVCPANTQIRLGVRPVWSESLLGTQWVAKDPRFLHVDSKDSDQTGQMPRLIPVFVWRTTTLLVL